MEVELIRPNADDPGVEAEVGVGDSTELLDQRRLAGDGRGVDLALLERRLADLHLEHGHRPPPAALLEVDPQDLARPVLVESDRFWGAGVGVRDGPGLALPRRVPVP